MFRLRIAPRAVMRAAATEKQWRGEHDKAADTPVKDAIRARYDCQLDCQQALCPPPHFA